MWCSTWPGPPAAPRATARARPTGRAAASLEAARTCSSSGSGSSRRGRWSTTSRTATRIRRPSPGSVDLSDAIDAGASLGSRPYYVFDPDEPSPAVLRARAARAAASAVAARDALSEHDFVHVADVGRAVVASVSTADGRRRYRLPGGCGGPHSVGGAVPRGAGPEPVGAPQRASAPTSRHSCNRMAGLRDGRLLRS